MKRSLILTMAAVLLLVPLLAAASVLVYRPESVSLTVPGGSSQQVQVSVNVAEPKGSSYLLWYLDSVGGTLPATWLTSAPVRSFIFRSSPGTATITVAVPTNAAPGTYSGTVLSRAQSTHDLPLKGAGIAFEVVVPSRCSAVPQISVESVTPQIIWPPDKSVTQVIASGTITAPEGCTLAEMGYVIEDEYQQFSSMGEFQLDGGAFAVALPVEAMRHGQDKDGRHYRLTIYARDEAGVASSPDFEVVVPHDRRD